jgi:GLPGLI family protein
MRYLLFFIILSNYPSIISQKQLPFSGELTYRIERVDVKDSSKSVQLIYAKDSLLKVVNFNADKGKQELIKHLRYNKSYLLIESPLQNFAIRTNEHLVKDTISKYTFKSQKGSKKIAGMRAKKVKVKLPSVQNELTFLYLKKIPAKYANIYTDFPGLPVLFYVSTPDGLFKYTLQEFKKASPPLELFMIPKDYKKVTFEEFAEEFSKLYENKE